MTELPEEKPPSNPGVVSEFDGRVLVTRVADAATCGLCGEVGTPCVDLRTDDPYVGDWYHEECFVEVWEGERGFPPGHPPSYPGSVPRRPGR